MSTDDGNVSADLAIGQGVNASRGDGEDIVARC